MDTKDFALGKQNLILIGIAFAVIILGFALMQVPDLHQNIIIRIFSVSDVSY